MRRDALEKRGDTGGQGACRGLETRNQETQKAERGSVCSVVRSAILKSPTDYFFKIPHISNIICYLSLSGLLHLKKKKDTNELIYKTEIDPQR